MAQAGDPQGNGTGGSGKKLKAEFTREPFKRGTVGMASAQSSDSGIANSSSCSTMARS